MTTTPSNPSPESLRCSHLDAANRRCRMLVAQGNIRFCAAHATEAAQAAEAHRLAAQQYGARSLEEINSVLAELFSAVSQRKVDLRHGTLLAYIAQLMIQTNKQSGTPTAAVPEVAPTG